MRVLVRRILAHAIDILWFHTLAQERLGDRLRYRRACHVEQRYRTEARDAARFLLRQDIHGVGRHAHDIGSAGLNDPVQSRKAGRRVVDHQFRPRHHRLAHRNPGDMMAERRQGQQDRPRIEIPVRHQIAAIGEQGVVRMHDALRSTRCARGESKIGHLVGITDKRPDLLPRFCHRIRHCSDGHATGSQAPNPAKARHGGKAGMDIMARRIGAVAVLDEDRSCPNPAEQRQHLVDCVVAVQRRVADITVARAGEKNHKGFEPVRHP